jgi:hypothetical protein
MFRFTLFREHHGVSILHGINPIRISFLDGPFRLQAASQAKQNDSGGNADKQDNNRKNGVLVEVNFFVVAQPLNIPALFDDVQNWQ